MFSTVIKILPHRIQPVFQHMDEALQNTLSQIHLKAGARVYVSVGGKNFYVTPQGKLSEKDGILLFENEVEECFTRYADIPFIVMKKNWLLDL